MVKQSLSLVNLDFDLLKSDFIEFLRGNPLWKDYDFTGSNLNLLIELLAQNTEKNAFLTNMLFSEAFLDSALLSASVFSHAKELNYIPRSCRSAKATIQLDFNATAENQPYILQKGQSFSTIVKNSQYIFTIPKTVIIASANTSFSITTDIYEGIYVKDSYVFQSNADEPYPRFRITNKKVDTDSLTVAVFEDGDTIGTSYNLVTSLLDLDNTSLVYFLQVDANGFYEVFFGDGVVGNVPKENSTVILDYRVTNDIIPNGASAFVINFDPTGDFHELNDGINNPEVTTIEQAKGGSKQEDIEAVRFWAPRHFQTQERMVVPSDYNTLMKRQFPEIISVNVYGGEDASPPQFGKVIVSVFLNDFETLPDSKKDEYTKFILRRCPLSIRPVFINPEFTFIEIDSIVRYNVNVTTNTPDRIITLVIQSIIDFNNTFLDDFNVIMRFSHLIRAIDDADPSILSNITNIRAYKKINVVQNIGTNYDIRFNFALDNDIPVRSYPHADREKTLCSSTFTTDGRSVFLEDDGNGNIHMVQFVKDQIVSIDIVGKVDYSRGAIQLVNLKIDAFEGVNFIIYVKPRDNDITVSKNTILTIEPQTIKLNIQPISA